MPAAVFALFARAALVTLLHAHNLVLPQASCSAGEACLVCRERLPQRTYIIGGSKNSSTTSALLFCNIYVRTAIILSQRLFQAQLSRDMRTVPFSSNGFAKLERKRGITQEFGQEAANSKAGHASPRTGIGAAAGRDSRLYVNDCNGIPSDKIIGFEDAEVGDGNSGDNGHRDNGGGQEEEEGGLLSALRVVLGTPESAWFFAAILPSGISGGVSDTFFFNR